MKRRNAIKMTAGAIVGGGAGLFAISKAFEPKIQTVEKSHKVEFKDTESEWKYFQLDPVQSAELAYNEYKNGSCMYGTFVSIVLQLAEKIGEPYASFPLHMMKYGHGGVGGYGTVCGALNGAAALIGLIVADKKIQDSLIADLFSWYEETPLPEFKPRTSNVDFVPPVSASNSPLCHASTTNWGKISGYKINSAERKERCRRLTADVASRVTNTLNKYHNNNLVLASHHSETANTCMTCHGKEGKLNNTSGKMNCTSCHTESIPHKIFANPHYKFMK